jgi:hypothetical protein
MSTDLIEMEKDITAFCETAYRLAGHEAWNKEAEALKLLLSRVWLALPFEPDVEEMDIIDKVDKSETGPNSGFAVTDKLTFHTEGRLSRSFVVRQYSKGRSFESKIEDFDLDYKSAIGLYGLETICTGLLDALRNKGTDISMKEEHQSRLRRASALVEVLERELDEEIALQEKVRI